MRDTRRNQLEAAHMCLLCVTTPACGLYPSLSVSLLSLSPLPHPSLSLSLLLLTTASSFVSSAFRVGGQWSPLLLGAPTLPGDPLLVIIL